MSGPRSTSTRTAAATLARRQASARRAATSIVDRLPLLDDAGLADLIRAAWTEMETREAAIAAGVRSP